MAGQALCLDPTHKDKPVEQFGEIEVCAICHKERLSFKPADEDLDLGGEPPLGPCPDWCELTPGHDWEDRWRDGLVRYHRRLQVIGGDKYHRIGLEEIEQVTDAGEIKRQRQLVLDVEAPTMLSKDAAIEAVLVAAKYMEMAIPDWPDGEVL